ncbi:hypothetical protein QJ857_gp1133 [Tupanvirus soda lake]|uniref:Right handed beta helix domain-containing protein n=2 Tax=Tupanvirus TaxID=2094720 RepID=A0A6N1P1I6_9VIRU|nr:hypothetical protein QJ857_gp1133 [Tupanvirus soda lake]QKU34921.1 hypothetical protein [Tupanvirus soda lake]
MKNSTTGKDFLEEFSKRRRIILSKAATKSNISSKNIASKQSHQNIGVELNNSILPSSLYYTANQNFPGQTNTNNNKKPNLNFQSSCYVKCKNNEIHTITQSDINSNGVIITCPGLYRFGSDILYNAANERTAAIIIAASDVILDLDRFSLIQNNNVPSVYGIVVARDSKRVKIIGEKNVASIRNFTWAGIRVFGRTEYVTIKNVMVQQQVPKQLTNEQIPVLCTDLINININLGIAVGEGDTVGLHMKNTNKTNLVNNLLIDGVVCDGSTIGCHIIFTFGIQVTNSNFTRNTFYGLIIGTGWFVPGDDQFGLEFPVAGDGVIKGCRFEKNYGNNIDLSNPEETYLFDFLSAIALYEVDNFKVTNNIVDDNYNSGYIIAADHDGSRNIEWTRSYITKTRSDFEPADGLHFSGSIPFAAGACLGLDIPLIQDFNVTIKDCAIADSVSGGSRAAGVVLAYVQGAHISNTNASGMIGGSQSAGFYFIGGLPGGRTSGITCTRCTAEKNGVTGQGISVGFLILNVTNDVVLRDIIANNNATSPDLTIAAGIAVISTSVNPDAVIENIDIDNVAVKGNGNGTNNSGGIVIYKNNASADSTITNVAVQKSVVKFNNGVGILLNGNIAGASFNENEVYQNTLGGIHIINNPNQVFVSRNVAYANDASNYIGVSPLNIIEGTTAAIPSVTGFLNVSILP